MFDLTTAAQATDRDLAAIIDRLDGLADADWNAPVRCQGWTVAADDGHAAATCEISGDHSPVALFVMGRISADHPSVTVSDLSAARAFKQYFPGP